MYTSHALVFSSVTAAAIVSPASDLYTLLLAVTGLLFALLIFAALMVLISCFVLRGVDAGARAYHRRGGRR